jgi:hypothetical protein
MRQNVSIWDHILFALATKKKHEIFYDSKINNILMFFEQIYCSFSGAAKCFGYGECTSNIDSVCCRENMK